MKIIIEVKDSATLGRIHELQKDLDKIDNTFPDVINEIYKEW